MVVVFADVYTLTTSGHAVAWYQRGPVVLLGPRVHRRMTTRYQSVIPYSTTDDDTLRRGEFELLTNKFKAAQSRIIASSQRDKFIE